ncbi:MAG TPA: TRAP transporter substrate-binding protein [Solirubrobacteraceae bacterium]|jgi:tripartite ATP-independent transporter DctP family solute receptor
MRLQPKGVHEGDAKASEDVGTSESDLSHRHSRRQFLARASATGLTLAGAGGLISACGSSKGKSGGGGGSGKGPYHWRTGLDVGPGNAIWDSYQNMLTSIEEKTNGEVKFDTFPNAQLGSEADNFKDLQNGSLEMNLITTSVITATVPELTLFSLPYVFGTNEDTNKAIVSSAKEGQEQALAAQGVHVIGWENAGARQLGGTSLYVHPSEIKNVKVRTVETPVFVEFFKAAGAVPTPLSSEEVFEALKQGVVDAYDQPLGNIVTFKWYEAANKLTLTSHAYSILFLGFNKKLWETLPSELQETITEVATENMASFGGEQQSIQEKAATELEAKGCKIEEADLEEWRGVAEKIYPKFASQVGGMSAIESLRSSQGL